MAPALTQTAEPPNLTDTICHTPKDSSAPNGVSSSYESLKEFGKDKWSPSVTTSKEFLESKNRYYLSNGDRVAPDLAPPAFGWAVGRPLPSNTSPYLLNMDDLTPLSLHDSCNKSIITCNKASSTYNKDKKNFSQESSNPCTISSVMGIQSCITNVASAPIDLKKEGTIASVAATVSSPVPLVNQVPHEESSTLLNQQSDLLNLLGRDFDYMSDIIDSLQGLLEIEPEVNGGPSLVSSQTILSPEDRATSILSHLSERQRVLERRRLFLLRRLHRVTARGLGMTVSSQLSHLIKHVHHVLEEKKKEMLSPRRGKREEAEPILSLEMLHKESMKTMSTSDLISLVRRVEASHNNLQHLSDSLVKKKQVAGVIPLPLSLCSQLDMVASEVRAATCTHLSHDSDATESSSGGESCDEAEGYSKSSISSTSSTVNQKSIRKRAYYRYCRQRGWIASRWMWLQAHIADLDYKFNQHQKIYKHIQKNKGVVQLTENALVKDRNPAHLDMRDPALTCIGSPISRTVLNGYHPSNKAEDASASCASKGCARTRGIEKVKRRRYVRPNMAMFNRSLSGMSNSTNKVKVSSVLCKCVPPLTCILCLKSRTWNKNKFSAGNRLTLEKTGQKAFLNMCTSEKLVKVDHAFHPVLSQPPEMLQGELYNTVLKSYDWQQKALVSRPVASFKEESTPISTLSQHEPFAKRKKREKDHKRNGRRRRTKDEGSERLIQLQNKRSLAEDEGDDVDDELDNLQVSVGGSELSSSSCPVPSPLPEKEAKALQLEAKTARKQSSTGRQKQNSTSSSYDINNIIIPCSMAASSRVELLQYKDIPTPKWRIEEIEPLVKSCKTKIEEEEDVSEEAIISRHSRSEEMERKKFLQYLQTQVNSSRSSRTRRADSSGTNTPDHPLSPRPLDSVESPPDTPFPGPSEDSNQSSLAFSSKSTSQTTVLTLSLSSLPSLQSSLLKSNDSEAKIPSIPMDCDESGSPFVNISSFRSQKNSTAPPSFLVSEGVPGLRTRRMLSNSSGSASSEKVRLACSGDEGNEKGRVSPFPCRHFPLNESEFEDLVLVENECNDTSPGSSTTSHILTRSGLKTRPDFCSSSFFPSHSMAEVVVAPVETDVESGRDSPLSELTDSAPEEEGPWEDGASVDWTISAVNDNCGGLVLTVQRN